MLINLKSIRGAVFVGGVAVALVGFIISTTKGVVAVVSTLERVNTTQSEIIQSNATTHQEFNGRLTAAEAWILRKEGYDAAKAEMEAENRADQD